MADHRLNRIEDKLDRVSETLTELATSFEGLPSRVRNLEDWRTRTEGRVEGGSWVWAKLMAFAGFVGGVVSFLFQWLGK